MRVRQNLVALKNVAYKETTIELTEQAKQSMMEEQMEQLDRLPILHVGDQVTDLKVGDEVYVDPIRLFGCSRLIIDGTAIILVRASDIQIVY